jgi:WD40 repeat protein
MEGHCDRVWALALSRDGELIASGDESGELITWYGETGESLTPAIKAHSDGILSLDFSPDGTVLASGSLGGTTKFWSTKTWRPQGIPIHCGDHVVRCVRYSPSGQLLAIATHGDIEIYNSDTKERVAKFKGHIQWNSSLAWIPDGTRLLSGGHGQDATIREWDTSTWQQVGDPWTGHTHGINAIAIHPAGTLAASASEDSSVRLWQLLDRLTIAVFQPSTSMMRCVAFSMDGNHILSGGFDNLISEWAIPKDASPGKALKKPASKVLSCSIPALSSTHSMIRFKFLMRRHVFILDSDNAIRAYFGRRSSP